MKKNFVEELRWRGLLHNIMPGTEEQLLKERVTKTGGFIEGKQYTRPEVFIPKVSGKRVKAKTKKTVAWKVPSVLLSGDHKKITEWKTKNSKVIE